MSESKDSVALEDVLAALELDDEADDVLIISTGEAREILRALPRTVPDGDGERLLEALKPSLETKQAYMGEFQFQVPDLDEDGNEVMRNVNVPWVTIKEIMAAIRSRAALPHPPSED